MYLMESNGLPWSVAPEWRARLNLSAWRPAGPRAVDQPIGPTRVEPQDPIAYDCSVTPPIVAASVRDAPS